MPSITIGSTSYDYNSQARAIGGLLPNYFNPALSFTIEEISDSKWSLRINQTDLVGLFNSRDYALGILMGLYTSHDGHEDSFSIWMNDSLTNRGSIINADKLTQTLILGFNSSYDVGGEVVSSTGNAIMSANWEGEASGSGSGNNQDWWQDSNSIRWHMGSVAAGSDYGSATENNSGNGSRWEFSDAAGAIAYIDKFSGSVTGATRAGVALSGYPFSLNGTGGSTSANSLNAGYTAGTYINSSKNLPNVDFSDGEEYLITVSLTEL